MGEDIGVAVLAERDGLPTPVAGLAQGRDPTVVRWADDFVALWPYPWPRPSRHRKPQAGPLALVSLADPPLPVLIGT